jgi:hypothetical protein
MIKDQRLPKRPVGAMLQFYKERHSSGDYKGMPFKDHAQLMHKEWTSLSAAARQVCLCDHFYPQKLMLS